MSKWIGAAIGAALFTFPAICAFAQDVELRSLDGTVELEGNLISYDGAFYRLDTVYGALTVSAEGVSCAGPGCPDLATFVAEARIAGAATITEGLLPALLEAFADTQGMAVGEEISDGNPIYVLRRPDGSDAARFFVNPGSTDDGFLALLNGEADIALALREPSVAEVRAAETVAPEDPPLDDRVRVLALDALVPVVSAENPIDTLSLPDIARLFSGEMTNWQELDGPDAPVALHLLSPGLGLAQAFAARVLLPSDAGLSQDVIRHDTAEALAEAVAADAYAVGITARSGEGPARALPLIGACGFPQSATGDAVKAEDYPLTAPVYMYLAPRRLPLLVRQFLAFTETEEAERRVREAGFVDQTLTRTPLALQGERLTNAIRAAGEDVELSDLQEVVEVLGHAERLSTTFRFNPGGADLDIQSRASIARLAAAIERGAFDGRRLIFAGFSDGNGPSTINARLSLRRAGVVQDALLAAAGAAAPDRVEMVTHGFGEAMPMACDDTDWGRAVNRRVEVWLD
ncbi:phosphate ABC transporter substrate-binding/OmpA family protein [Hasllibacter sp. MH4015]|uniref:phosphate ABC transporter substrate-binding/OmpA family protein n=1 Tax=Hasllibacter sp. MH4015 TaxID=2854029 RepID=UPI001CD749EC|nr:phosphate ABC transporter substrate-binding/OmpA family protein [Hasllibacter sp. MH4015]